MTEGKTKTLGKKKEKMKNTVKTRGRIFTGVVSKVFPKRAVIEFEKNIYVQKYER